MPYRILGDMHTHTLYSRHAYSTIMENVAEAAARGLEIYGAADHFSAMLFPEQHIRNFQHFINQEIWPREWMGVTVLRACEADILTLEGGLFGEDIAVPESIVGRPYKQDKSLFERVTDGLDYVVASVHNADFTSGASLVQTTEMYLGALENPKVFILGHTGRSGVPYDLDEVIGRARDLHKLIEVNEHSLEGMSAGRHVEACRTIAEKCAELGCGICVDSDAHIAPQIGRYGCVTDMLEEIHFPEELIVDRGCEPFLRELAASGVADLTGLLEG